MRELIISIVILIIILFIIQTPAHADEYPVLHFKNMQQFDGSEINTDGYYKFHRDFFFRMFNHYLPIFTRHHENREALRKYANGRKVFYITVKVVMEVEEKD